MNNSFSQDKGALNTGGTVEFQGALTAMRSNCMTTSCHVNWPDFTTSEEFVAERGAHIIPGDGANSNFFKLTIGQGTGSYEQMPPSGSRPIDNDAQAIKAWIDSLSPAP